MSTDKIIEILRHHDNPCAVLEPFDLESAIKQSAGERHALDAQDGNPSSIHDAVHGALARTVERR